MQGRLACIAGAFVLVVGFAGLGCSRESPPAPPAQPANQPVVAAATATTATTTTTTPPAADALAGEMEKLLIWADADPDEGDAPLTTELTADPLEDINQPKYVWDFGDNTPNSNEQNPKHTYTRPGDYKARVRVTDANGNIGEDEVLITVDAPEPPKAKQEPKPADGNKT